MEAIVTAYVDRDWSTYWRLINEFIEKASDERWSILVRWLDQLDAESGGPPEVPKAICSGSQPILTSK